MGEHQQPDYGMIREMTGHGGLVYAELLYASGLSVSRYNHSWNSN
jgi:hypothetical protein